MLEEFGAENIPLVGGRLVFLSVALELRCKVQNVSKFFESTMSHNFLNSTEIPEQQRPS